MAVLTLPTSPAPRSVTPRLITSRAELSPAFGGPVQRISRMGSRWAFDFVMPPMTYATALDWEGLLAEADTVLMNLPEPGLVKPDYGTPLVDGAGQSGSTLDVDGLENNEIVKGKWLSIVTSSQRYLYRTTAAVTPSSGVAELALRPMLRVSPANNDVIELATPKIEGFVSMADGALEVSVDRIMHGLAFTIVERA